MRALPKLAHVAALAALFWFAACASPQPPAPAHGPPGLKVIVENHGWEDVSVYASMEGARRRLGSVSSGRTAAFQIRSLTSRAAHLELVAAPMARSDPHRSGRLMVYAGQTVTWTIHQSRLGGDVTIR